MSIFSLSYLRALPYVIAFLLVSIPAASAQSPIDGIDARANTNDLARQLGNPDPLVRQKSAEALARLAATDQKKIVEGYQLQEKNKEVRLALDWALYRMGHSEALFRVVKELDSGRQDQAVGYLWELENPDLLYPYLQKQNNPSRLNAGLMKAFARIGNSETLEMIKSYRESLQPKVAEAAEAACDEIEKRMGQPEAQPGKRHLFPAFPRANDRVQELLKLLLREIYDIALGDPRDTNLPGVKRQQPEDLAGKLQKGPQRIQDASDPGLPTTTLLRSPPEVQEMSDIEGCHRLIPYIPDHPLERLPVARDRQWRAPHLVTRPFQKRGAIIPMVRDEVPSSPPDMRSRLIRVEGTWAREVIECG